MQLLCDSYDFSVRNLLNILCCGFMVKNMSVLGDVSMQKIHHKTQISDFLISSNLSLSLSCCRLPGSRGPYSVYSSLSPPPCN